MWFSLNSFFHLRRRLPPWPVTLSHMPTPGRKGHVAFSRRSSILEVSPTQLSPNNPLFLQAASLITPPWQASPRHQSRDPTHVEDRRGQTSEETPATPEEQILFYRKRWTMALFERTTRLCRGYRLDPFVLGRVHSKPAACPPSHPSNPPNLRLV